MKSRSRYQVYPTKTPIIAFDQLFGCVRVIWKDVLAHWKKLDQKGEKKPKKSELQNHFLSQKKDGGT
ncbi:helix-turn-helix domain-containing protein [Microcoleus sp. MON1_C5]|uniref:helix-turn-helix domain-containing protein n=1 Tax=Microcoleus sp. MON1_C5 TaxID=2818828 RepID=UPI00403F9DAF